MCITPPAPTWKLAETVHFYRDLLGLPLVHAISARGWGPEDHADFLHFFFDSGNGSTIAFFYYIGTTPPDFVEVRDDYRYRASHTAWRVTSREDLLACREKIEAAGIHHARSRMMPSIFVLNVPEFLPLVEHARAQSGYRVDGPRLGYWQVSGNPVLSFRRKELGFKPAVWHGALTGGLVGVITHFDNDTLTIAEAAS